MDQNTQAVPGYYVWALPDNPIVVHLHLSVIDRLSAEIMRGFGATPKRAAEIGGVLLGTVEQGEQTIVKVEDTKRITCMWYVQELGEYRTHVFEQGWLDEIDIEDDDDDDD